MVKIVLKKKLEKLEAEIQDRQDKIAKIDARLEQHSVLEQELKNLRTGIKEAEKKKDDLMAAARSKISEDEARRLILERFHGLLVEEYRGYLRRYNQEFIKAVENLWDKYAVSLRHILQERDKQAQLLDGFMCELGYE